MRAIQISEPKTLRRIEIDSPEQPGKGFALVKTHRMGVCGTDISCYLGKFPFFDFPRIPGHELGVEVLAVGPGVSNEIDAVLSRTLIVDIAMLADAVPVTAARTSK